MRKAIITLLAVLMLISFVSCNDQKVTEEMREQATKDFMTTGNTSSNYFVWTQESSTNDLSNWNSTTADEDEISLIKYIIGRFVQSSSFDIVSAEGTVEIDATKVDEDSYGEESLHVIAKGVKISYTANNEEKNLELDYDITSKTTYDNKDATKYFVVKSLKLNGTTYRPIELEETWNDETKTGGITRAICDGIELDCAKVEELIMQQSE